MSSSSADSSLANLRETVSDPTLRDTFEQDVIDGLTAPKGQKAIPPKHLYDARGSRLFEQICETNDYYPTRTEHAIYEQCMDEIAERIGAGSVVVEPGSGDGTKAETLLSALDRPRAFAPLEISRSALAESSERIARHFPDTDIHPVCGEFATGLRYLEGLPEDRRLIFFPGSTIGNMVRAVRKDLLDSFADFIAKGDDGRALIGFDLVKDRDVLRAAYDDSAGVTAEFNYNLIDRMNRELDAGLDRDTFRYRADWSEARSRIEMGLECTEPQEGAVLGSEYHIEHGERIHTEHSHKFTEATIREEAAASGLRVTGWWTDERRWFAVVLLEAVA